MMIMSSGWIMSSPWPAELLWYIPGRLYHIIPIVFGILRESFIQHVNTCDVPGILFGILGNLKYRLCWSQTFLSFPLCWSRACFGMMIGVYGVDIHNMIFPANLTSVLFFMWTDQFLVQKIRLGFVFHSQMRSSSSAKDELKQHSSELNYIKEPPGKSSGNSGFQGEEHVMNGAFPPSHVWLPYKSIIIYIYRYRYYKIACEEHAFMLFWHGHWMTMRSWMPLYFFQL